MLHLQSGDSINAEAYINRASHLEHATNDEELRLQFRAQRVRIFDFKRKFIDAAQGCVAFTACHCFAQSLLLTHFWSLIDGHCRLLTAGDCLITAWLLTACHSLLCSVTAAHSLLVTL